MFKSLGVSVAALLMSSVSSLIYGAEPFDSIRTLELQPYNLPNSYVLLDQILSSEATVFVDVESSAGAAARYVASNTSEDVKIYSINAWEGAHLYQQFLSNVFQENISDRIISLRMSSAEASEVTNISADVIFFDGSDASTLSEKIISWFSHLNDNGTLMGNNWHWNDVKLAVIEAATALNLEVNITGDYWFLNRP